MDKPFPAESSPFLAPYPPPGPGVPGIKPFKAVDLVPPLGQGSPWIAAQPQASPFLERDSTAPALAPSEPNPPAVAVPLPAPIAAPTGPQASPAALRASATPRPASGNEVQKSALIMTDADTASEAAGAEAAGAEAVAIAAEAKAARLPITTSPNLEGRSIRAYLGIVSVEIVIPKDILFRNPAPYGEMHRIRAAEEQLQSVKSKAFEELADKARALGANAVVGASLQFSQFDAVVFLCSAVGTAVKVG